MPNPLAVDNFDIVSDPISMALGFAIAMPVIMDPEFDVQGFNPKSPRINPLAVDSPDIVRWIEAKRPHAIGSWQELGAQEYGRAFTAAGTTGYDVIGDLYDGLLDVMRQQGGETDFVEHMLPVLRGKGWLPALDDEALGRRLRLIYDTNLRTSQAVGKWRGAQRTKQYLPYFRYSAVMDRRTRPSHAALHGIIRPVDDGFWDAAFPPCGFGCRCVVQQMSRSQAARHGGPSTAESASEALASARALSKGDGDFWGRNVGAMADAAALDQVQRVNDRRIEGAPPLTGLAVRGASAWLSLFADKIAGLLVGP
jgi:SPP1 gp7 family putative phage head morphogenesis protein